MAQYLDSQDLVMSTMTKARLGLPYDCVLCYWKLYIYMAV